MHRLARSAQFRIVFVWQKYDGMFSAAIILYYWSKNLPHIDWPDGSDLFIKLLLQCCTSHLVFPHVQKCP